MAEPGGTDDLLRGGGRAASAAADGASGIWPRRPAFYLAIALLAGSVLGTVISTPPAATFVAMLVALGTAFHLARRGRALEAWRGRLGAARCLLVVFFLLALGREQAETRRFGEALEVVREFEQRSGVWMRGVVAAEPVARKGGSGFRVVLRRAVIGDGESGAARALPRRVEVTVKTKAWPGPRSTWPLPGEGLEVRARPMPPPGPTHATLFDHGAWLRARGVGAVATVQLAGSVGRVAKPSRPLITRVCAGPLVWRRGTLERLERRLGDARAAVAAAMLLGETTGLDAPTRRAFSNAGISHLFAVSGLHTAMLAALVFGLFRLFGFPPRSAAWALIAFLTVYALVVGFRAPVVRASIMAGCLCIPLIARRAVDTLNVLCVAVCAVLLVDPGAPLRVDFQFSYLCVLAMVALRPALSETLTLSLHARERTVIGKRAAYFYNALAGQGLASVLAAQYATVPLVAYYFHRVSIVAVVSNLVMVPLAGLVLMLGWVFALLGPLGAGLEGLTAASLRNALDIFLSLGRAFAAAPGGSFPSPAFPWWLTGLWYAVLLQGSPIRLRRAPGAREARRAALFVRLALLTAALVWWPLASRAPWVTEANSVRLTMLDVGQGDCLVLQGSTGMCIAVDTGRPGAAENLLRYLEGSGVDRLAALVLTHFDLDHVGSTADILHAMEVGRILVGSEWGDSKTLQQLRREIALSGVPVVRLRRGDVIRGIGVPVSVLSPPETISDGANSNDRSLVLLVDAGEMEFLLMGDAGLDVESWLASQDASGMLDVEVLKVGHHGSHTATSAAFVHAASPVLALISAGRNNQYGHPAPQVVERLERGGARILNTQVHGTVEILAHEGGLSVRAARLPEEN